MRRWVPIELPVHLVRLHKALDFWKYKGKWDSSGFDWITIRQHGSHPLRTALINDQLSGFAFTEAGEIVEIPPSIWGGPSLWSAAYETGLTNVPLRGRIATGYLCVDRRQLEELWRGESSNKNVDAETILDLALAERVAAECPTIGVVAKAAAMKQEASTFVTVDTWLRNEWPESLNHAWPARDVNHPTPSIARQLNLTIRRVGNVPLKWIAAEPEDELVFDLKQSLPILAAALEVHRLCKSGALDDRGKVYPAAARRELEKRVGPRQTSGLGNELFRAIAQLVVPDDKVSGGGRKRA